MNIFRNKCLVLAFGLLIAVIACAEDVVPARLPGLELARDIAQGATPAARTATR
jgi:hypothetical protein